MPWWAWMVLGIGLLGVEMFVIDAQFYLVFIGLSAAIVGLLGLVGRRPAGLVPVAGVRRCSPSSRWSRSGAACTKCCADRRGHVDERLTIGDRIVVDSRIEPGQTGRVEYRGSSWNARNTGAQAIEPGREAVIAQVDGLTLHIKVE